MQSLDLCVILGFRREEDENCALLRCHAASSGNFLPINYTATRCAITQQSVVLRADIKLKFYDHE